MIYLCPIILVVVFVFFYDGTMIIFCNKLDNHDYIFSLGIAIYQNIVFVVDERNFRYLIFNLNVKFIF